MDLISHWGKFVRDLIVHDLHNPVERPVLAALCLTRFARCDAQETFAISGIGRS